MRYQLALVIHDRIEEVLRLIRTGEYSTPALAEAVGISIPTISRIVAALWERGYDNQAKLQGSGRRYFLVDLAPAANGRLVFDAARVGANRRHSRSSTKGQ
jgi:hypothetical protein